MNLEENHNPKHITLHHPANEQYFCHSAGTAAKEKKLTSHTVCNLSPRALFMRANLCSWARLGSDIVSVCQGEALIIHKWSCATYSGV